MSLYDQWSVSGRLEPSGSRRMIRFGNEATPSEITRTQARKAGTANGVAYGAQVGPQVLQSTQLIGGRRFNSVIAPRGNRPPNGHRSTERRDSAAMRGM